jgi:hypothetical protein
MVSPANHPALSDGQCSSLKHLVFERDAFRVVFLKPPFGGFPIGEHLEVVDVADILLC